ncbi:MAG: flagellar hook-length control protein FliK [Ignavibacteriae bacterium]|nr:flagellar hook-length control protein FliK [Ignavibacteriota bacterium]NOG97141.1 flagellar hook-length control protein FliK [Ignavibacteriota bacterium]
MLFNPIFINPEKLLSTPETGGTKQNKLSYLFSDIIKNSLGVKKQVSESEIESINASNLISAHSAKDNLKVNTEIELTETDKKIISELNSILSAIGNTSANDKTETIKIENLNNEKIEISTDDEAAGTLLSGLINLIEKHNLQIETVKSEQPENVIKEFNSSDFKNILPELKKIINQLDADKQLQVTINVGGKKIDLNIAKPKLENAVKDAAVNTAEPEVQNVKNETTVQSEKIVGGNTNQAKAPISTELPIENKAAESKNDLTSIIKNAAPQDVNGNSQKAEVNLNTVPAAAAEIKAVKTSVNENSVSTTISKIKLDVKIRKAAPILRDVVFNSSAKLMAETQKVENETSTSKISIKVIKAAAEIAGVNNNNSVNAATNLKNTDTEKNNASSKLIQSIKKIESSMLRQDIVPRQIKFSPVAVDEIKNQKFEFLNLATAVRTIKSLNKPIAEQVDGSSFKLNINNSAGDENNKVNIKNITDALKPNTGIKTDNNLEMVKETLPKSENTIKPKTENEINVSSKEILTTIKSSSKSVEIKKLQEFLSLNRNEKLSIKIFSAEPEVKANSDNIIKSDIIAEPAKPNAAQFVQQKGTGSNQFEMELQKFEKAVKEKGGSKNIREFISNSDKLEKARIVIEPVKTNAAEKNVAKINEAAKINVEENLKTVQNNLSGKEEFIIKEASRLNEVRSAESQKEIRVEANQASEKETASNENSGSSGKQNEQNSYSKGAAVESNKYQTVNSSEEFSEELQNANIAKPLESAQTLQTGELNTAAKQMPEIVRDVKAAELYKELYKIIEKKEHQSITLQVIPKKLGRVKVVVDIVDQMVQTKIEVENESAKQLLQNNMDTLKQSLSQSGIQLSNYSVSLSSSNNKTYRPFNSKKKDSGDNEPENTENENMPISGKKMGYNTYEYLI